MSILAGTRLGRYEIRSKIGEGGMGEVYLAQDTKLDRKVALKTLPADVAADRSRMNRFVLEAKAVSALNHPNIITIYEIDETDHGHFIATEYIDGETLRERESRAALTLKDSIDIAIQVANALAAAHLAGIVHRDIKPENVMVRHDGIAKVLDFGLAKLIETRASGPEELTRPMSLTRSGVVLGTVAYMSPEQARGQQVDERSDIWSFGVLLYEMVAKRLPFDGPSSGDIIVSVLEREPSSLASIVPAVPGELQRIISKSLRKDREERYQQVRDLLVDLKTLRQTVEQLSRPTAYPQTIHSKIHAAGSDNELRKAASFLTTTRNKVLVAITTAILIIVAVAAWFFFFNNRVTVTEKDTLLLADFVNTTGDATFDGSTLKQALAVQLRQTPFLNLFPEEGVRETLRYMGRSEDDRLTKQVAREICIRNGLKALVVGSIASVGHNYAITLEALNGQTGQTIASQQVEAESKEQVLKSLGQATLDLRRQLGESLAYLQKYNAPIEQATTSSLEALNIYSKGLEEIYRGDYKSALPLFNHAVELDPNFADAYVWLSWTYANSGDFAKTSQFAEKAYSLRDHVTELEKLHIDEIYHLWTTGDFEKQKQADELTSRLYSNDWLAHNSLAIAYIRIGQHERAVAEGRAGLRANPNESHLYWHLANALSRLNRFDEARDVIKQGQSRNLDHPLYRVILYQVALVTGNNRDLQEQLDVIQTKDGEAAALAIQVRTAILQGRWSEAQELSNRQAALAGRSGAAPPVTLTLNGALFGFCEPASPQIRDALSTTRIVSSSQVTFVPINSNGSLCGAAVEAQKLADEQTKRFPNNLQLIYSLPLIRAAIALQHERADQALEFLNPTIPYEGSNIGFWPNYLRGQTYLRLKRGPEAAAEFQKILDHRGWDSFSPMYPLAYLGLARAEMLRGDTVAARRHYDEFFAFWKDADADIPILIEAKKEYEKLK